MKDMIISVNIEGSKKATLKLTEMEIKSAISVCSTNALESVIVMKKHNGGACFYTDQRAANAAQERHNFEYSFTVKSEDLQKYVEDNTPKTQK